MIGMHTLAARMISYANGARRLGRPTGTGIDPAFVLHKTIILSISAKCQVLLSFCNALEFMSTPVWSKCYLYVLSGRVAYDLQGAGLLAHKCKSKWRRECPKVLRLHLGYL